MDTCAQASGVRTARRWRNFRHIHTCPKIVRRAARANSGTGAAALEGAWENTPREEAQVLTTARPTARGMPPEPLHPLTTLMLATVSSRQARDSRRRAPAGRVAVNITRRQKHTRRPTSENGSREWQRRLPLLAPPSRCPLYHTWHSQRSVAWWPLLVALLARRSQLPTSSAEGHGVRSRVSESSVGR